MGISVNVLVGRCLCRMRQCASVSQDELARATGVSKVSISHIESGRSVANPDMLGRFAPCLGFKPDEMVAITELASNANILYRTWRILRKRESWMKFEDAARELGL